MAAVEVPDEQRRSRRRQKKKNPAAAQVNGCRSSSSSKAKLESNLNVGRRWFSVYDVFRCKQLQIQLSTTTIPHRTRSLKPDDPHKPLITEEPRQKSFGADDAEVVLNKLHKQDPEIESQNRKQVLNLNDLNDPIRISDVKEDQRTRKSVELLRRMEMVRKLQSDDPEQQQAAAGEIRAATRRDGEARTTLALMGAIPPLVSMLESTSGSCSSAALSALLNLAVRNDLNKAAIAAAGAVPKIIKLIKHPAATAALLSLSALDSNKPIITNCSGALPAIVAAIEGGGGEQTRRDATGALYNLSLCAASAAPLCVAGAVPALVRAVGEATLASRAAAAAANLAATVAGRRALAREEGSGVAFLGALGASWAGHGGCQLECAAYVVMVLAQCSAAQRRALARAGASSVLLELVLLGSPAAQEWASVALGFLGEGSCDSGSYCCSLLLTDEDGEEEQQRVREREELEIYSEERRAVNKLVQQSLRLNMERITKRACIPFVSPSL